MDVVRNFIKVSGIADEQELLSIVSGQIIQYSENDTIFIPENMPEIENLFNVVIDIDIRKSRRVNTTLGSTIILDGLKLLKVIYASKEDGGRVRLVDLELPYNTFVELPKNVAAFDTRVYIIDAYFSLLDSRRIYSHIVYLVYANHEQNKAVNNNSDGGYDEVASSLI